IWAKALSGSSEDYGYAIAVDGSGNPIVAGSFLGGVAFAAGQFSSFGDNDVYVAKYSSSGAEVWFQRFGSTGSDVANGVGVESNGDTVLTGTFQQTVDFGEGPVTATGGQDIFLMRRAAATGGHVWSRTFPGTSYE